MRAKKAAVVSIQKTPQGVENDNLAERMKRLLIGQDEAVDKIVPFIELYNAGFCQKGRPVANILCLGTTGVGKTLSAEVLAECLHGNRNSLLRIDCGEYQRDHETAKLVGAPPGYLGHRETQALISQKRLTEITSDRSSLSIIVFDEIEKASISLSNLLLGIMDKGTMRTGDNIAVNFDNSIIFLTSNLGAKALKNEIDPGFGFSHFAEGMATSSDRLSSIGNRSAKNHFSPEFKNRIDETITYNQLTKDHLRQIVDLELNSICDHLDATLQGDSFGVEIPEDVIERLVEKGFSKEYGARDLKRVLRKEVVLPLARLYNDCRLGTGSVAVFSVIDNKIEIKTE